MNEPVNHEARMELLVERLISIVGKSNERIDSLHKRVLYLERMLLQDSIHSCEKKTTSTMLPQQMKFLHTLKHPL